MIAVVLPTNPTPLINGVRALGIGDIKRDVIIAAYDGTTWQIFKVAGDPYYLEPTSNRWATMTNLAPASRNETLPRNLANLGVVPGPDDEWVLGCVAIFADDLPQLKKARWSYDTPFLF